MWQACRDSCSCLGNLSNIQNLWKQLLPATTFSWAPLWKTTAQATCRLQNSELAATVFCMGKFWALTGLPALWAWRVVAPHSSLLVTETTGSWKTEASVFQKSKVFPVYMMRETLLSWQHTYQLKIIIKIKKKKKMWTGEGKEEKTERIIGTYGLHKHLRVPHLVSFIYQ